MGVRHGEHCGEVVGKRTEVFGSKGGAMQYALLQGLTWSTIVGSVVSALLLAAGESGLPSLSNGGDRDAPASDVRNTAPGDARTAIHPARDPAASHVRRDMRAGHRSR
jgi:hypothetical protein